MNSFCKSLWILALLAGYFSPVSGQMSMNVTLVGQWYDSTLITIPFGNGQTYNEVWGFVQDGREYAVLGSVEGTHIIDLNDPANPVQVDYIPGKTNPVVHRDYHDYGGYLYIAADDGPNGLQVADLSYLPDSVHIVYDSDTLFDEVHNIFIDSSRAVLYAVSVQLTSGQYRALTIVDLSNPAVPTFVRNYSLGSGQFPHDMYIENDTAFVNGGSSGLFLLNVANPAQPQYLGLFSAYIDLVYNHSGWTDPGKSLYYFVDEWHGNKVKVLDYSDPSNLTVIHTFSPSSRPDSIVPHNLMIRDGFLFLSNYADGLRIFNVVNPLNPVLTGFFDTYPWPDGSATYDGAWGVYTFLPSGLVLISDMQTGLYVFDVGVATSVKEPQEAASLQVGPVPARNRFVVSSDLAGVDAFEVRNLEGKLLGSWPVEFGEQELEVNAESWPAGTYLVLAIHEGQVVARQKIVFGR